MSDSTDHMPNIGRRTDRTHGIERTFHRHRCSCGHKDPERLTRLLAWTDQYAHRKEAKS